MGLLPRRFLRKRMRGGVELGEDLAAKLEKPINM